jgi:tRNA threonylcarbamoyladenosine biosynthesis protein TsaE
MNWVIRSVGTEYTERIAELLGGLIEAPEIIELRSDLGGGKTAFTRGLVRGLGSKDRVGSPTFSLKKIYKAGSIEIHHFDFYRLNEPGVVSDQLSESLKDEKVITVVEWADIVRGVLPNEHISIEFRAVSDNEDERVIVFEFPQSKMVIIEKLRTKLTNVKP